MATSGRVNTNTLYDSFFWVKWEQKSQDITANKTTILWQCGVTCGHSFYSNAIKMSAVSINGVKVYAGGTYSNYSNGEHTIASGTLEVAHNEDGTKSFGISAFTGWLYSKYDYAASASTHELTKIPRAASITGADNFTDTGNPKITYSNPAGNAVTALEACISLTGAKDDIKYRSITKTGSSYTFNLTDDERKVLRNNTTGTSRTVYFCLRTNIGGSILYSSLGKTFTVTANDATKPAVNLTASLNNGNLPSKFSGLYIQGKSKVDVTVKGDGKFGATISNRYAVVEGKTYKSDNFTSDVITGSGDVVITGYAVDSRGFTGTAEAKVNVIPYSKPLVVPVGNENAILCYRSDGNGKRTGNSTSLWVKAKRSFYNVNGKNTCALQWRRKPASNIWSDDHLWEDLIPATSSTNEYNALISGEVFELKQAYTVQIRVIDDVGEVDIKTFEIPTQDVALHLGHGGKNVAIGTYCDYDEAYTLYSSWKAIFGNGVQLNGPIYVGDMPLEEYIVEVIYGG